jgi:fibronectin-binding autotransporter adhesin
MKRAAPRIGAHLLIRAALMFIGAIALMFLPGGPTASAAPTKTCRVVNRTQGIHYPPNSGPALTTAIAAASPGDELEVVGRCVGVYALDKDLTVTGISTKRFPAPTLDANHVDTTLIIETGVEATLTNLTITGGAFSEQRGFLGAGIYNNGTLTLTSCTVSNNGYTGGPGEGAGIYNDSAATLALNTSAVTGNGATRGGGGGIVNAGTATISSSAVSNNQADFSGGISNSGSMTVQDSTVAENGASAGTGGIYNPGTMTLSSSSITDNVSALGAPGGVLNSGTLTVESSTISGNGSGGIVNLGTLTLNLSMVIDNSVGDLTPGGGGIYNAGTGLATLNSSTVTMNTAVTNGGGMYNDGGAVALFSSSVTDNTALFGEGGGIFNNVDSGGTVTLDSSIVSGNIPDDCVGVPGC